MIAVIWHSVSYYSGSTLTQSSVTVIFHLGYKHVFVLTHFITTSVCTYVFFSLIHLLVHSSANKHQREFVTLRISVCVCVCVFLVHQRKVYKHMWRIMKGSEDYWIKNTWLEENTILKVPHCATSTFFLTIIGASSLSSLAWTPPKRENSSF